MAALASTVEGEINSGSSSTALLISANSMPWRNFFYVHSCAGKNSSRENNHAPFRGDLSCFWQDLAQSPYIQNLTARVTAIPEIWMGPTKFKKCHVT